MFNWKRAKIVNELTRLINDNENATVREVLSSADLSPSIRNEVPELLDFFSPNSPDDPAEVREKAEKHLEELSELALSRSLNKEGRQYADDKMMRYNRNASNVLSSPSKKLHNRIIYPNSPFILKMRKFVQELNVKHHNEAFYGHFHRIFEACMRTTQGEFISNFDGFPDPLYVTFSKFISYSSIRQLYSMLANEFISQFAGKNDPQDVFDQILIFAKKNSERLKPGKIKKIKTVQVNKNEYLENGKDIRKCQYKVIARNEGANTIGGHKKKALLAMNLFSSMPQGSGQVRRATSTSITEPIKYDEESRTPVNNQKNLSRSRSEYQTGNQLQKNSRQLNKSGSNDDFRISTEDRSNLKLKKKSQLMPKEETKESPNLEARSRSKHNRNSQNVSTGIEAQETKRKKKHIKKTYENYYSNTVSAIICIRDLCHDNEDILKYFQGKQAISDLFFVGKNARSNSALVALTFKLINFLISNNLNAYRDILKENQPRTDELSVLMFRNNKNEENTSKGEHLIHKMPLYFKYLAYPLRTAFFFEICDTLSANYVYGIKKLMSQEERENFLNKDDSYFLRKLCDLLPPLPTDDGNDDFLAENDKSEPKVHENLKGFLWEISIFLTNEKKVLPQNIPFMKSEEWQQLKKKATEYNKYIHCFINHPEEEEEEKNDEMPV
ncbi:hypothetical protein TRFO_30891 [Tritrichomonas foetus]|uniref:Uncharacterized protein n=1 Tax=Tritrichomonas foetus TaxID=1144522 RepID=A0A1J4JTQ2_9EUKA|nr:hypothetical protein TRFO_30891 [Tritrichomonas foetus]|eukprot:OHT02130.1 hypothetical protein TRFO_30891 [Tritrichomonas foetus]